MAMVDREGGGRGGLSPLLVLTWLCVLGVAGATEVEVVENVRVTLPLCLLYPTLESFLLTILWNCRAFWIDLRPLLSN